VAATLYGIKISHPSQAARLMLERKGVDHHVVWLPPGSQPFVLRMIGFRGTTVPALRLNGKRIQGSRLISRELDRLQPEPPLFPSEVGRRRAVERAEEWGDRLLQPVPRRIFRWALATRPDLRRWMAEEVMQAPAPGVVAVAFAPVARAFSHKSRGSDDRVRADVAALPGMLDYVDGLIAEGTIAGEERNAADYQIGTSLWALMAFSELRPMIEARPAARLLAVLPPQSFTVPPVLPRDWLRE
jgi:glutathione S-transferase